MVAQLRLAMPVQVLGAAGAQRTNLRPDGATHHGEFGFESTYTPGTVTAWPMVIS